MLAGINPLPVTNGAAIDAIARRYWRPTAPPSPIAGGAEPHAIVDDAQLCGAGMMPYYVLCHDDVHEMLWRRLADDRHVSGIKKRDIAK